MALVRVPRKESEGWLFGVEMNWPGSLMSSPYTSSAGEWCSSSLSVARMLSRTSGRAATQSAGNDCALSASFSRLWKRSTRPLD